MDNFGDTKVRGSGTFVYCGFGGRNKTCDSHIYYCCQHADIHGGLCCQKDRKEKTSPDPDDGNLWFYISIGVFLGFVLLVIFIFLSAFTCGKERRKKFRAKLRKVAWGKRTTTEPVGNQLGRVDSSTRIQMDRIPEGTESTIDHESMEAANTSYQACDISGLPGSVPRTSLYPNARTFLHIQPPRIVSPAPLHNYHADSI